jgi:IclR family pca regulon transcriptional regulator
MIIALQKLFSLCVNIAAGKSEMSDSNPRYFLKSLAKGLHVLEILAESRRPLSLVELSRKAGANNATVTRICHTLTELGYVSRDRARRFHPTPKILSLGYASMDGIGWREVARHYLEELAESTGETVNLSILQDRELMYLVRINNTGRILPFDLQLGSRLPLHCTSMGKALLAFADPDDTARILADYEFTPITHNTITNHEDFRHELNRVREQGYSLNDEELSYGLRSVSAPIKDLTGKAMAALNIAVPTKRVSREDLEQRLAPLAVETALKIQKALGSIEDT